MFQFFSQAFISHYFLWTSTVQFWRSCQKTFDKNPENFNLVSKNELVFFSKGIFCHDGFPLARRKQFRQPSWKFSINFPESFRPISESEKKCLSKTFSHKLHLWKQVMQFWQPCLKSFDVNLKSIRLKCEIQLEKCFFKGDASHENNPEDT